MALFGVLAIDSVVLHRLYTAAPLPPALRPTLGIQLAPATVGAVAYLGLNAGPPDWFAHAMIGYALIQTLILARLWRWIREQPFAVSYWSFTFGLTAFAYALLRMLEKGETGSAVPLLAIALFVVANGVVAGIMVATFWLLAKGRLLGAPPAPTVAH
jgi:tellurite resistance protein